MKHCAIIGGGIIGLSTAYYLNKEGYTVTVIDQSDILGGASFVNAGFLTPSHFIPLAAPGMIAKGIKYMFDSSSPFYMKPRLDKDFIKWVLLFNRSCSKKNVNKSVHALLEINLYSQKLFNELKSSKDFNFHLENRGLLMAYQEITAEKQEGEIAAKAIKLGLKIDKLNSEDLAKMEPNLIAKGAYHYHSDSHMTPTDFMRSMKVFLDKNGVRFKLNEKVLDIIPHIDAVEIKTPKDQYKFDELIIATGAWSERLAKKLGQYIPIQAGKGYCIDSKRHSGITFPTILSEAKVAVSPMDGFTRFAGTMELAGLDHKLNFKRVRAITDFAKRYYKNFEFNNSEIEEASFGFRPVSPDGLPFIGKIKNHRNITLATGHAMMGWSLGPATGKLVEKIISNKKTSIDLAPYSVGRFS